MQATDVTHALVALQHRSQALEAELRETRAREARYLDVIAGLVGHDLRGPLGAVMMSADAIARLNLGERPSRHAGRITATAVRMSRMIDQLLDFTQIGIGRGVALVLGDVDLAAVCARVRDELDDETCEVVVEASGDLRGRWDADCLAQVLATVIGNAITHGRGGVAIQLVGGEDVVIRVRNDGAMPAAALGRLFEPAWPDKNRHKAHGLGLGLFVARAFIAAHGGTIDVASSEAAGTTVRIALPRSA